MAKKGLPPKRPVARTKQPQSTGAEIAVSMRKNFYSSMNKVLGLGVIASSAALLIGSGGLMIAASKDEVVKFVAVNEQGQLIKMVPLGAPNLSDQAVIQWTSSALVDTFTFSAYDINFRLNESTAKYFTNEGAEALLSEYKNSGNFDAVIENEMFVSIALEHAPLMVDYITLPGGYFGWSLIAPAKLTFRTGTRTETNNVNIELVVSRRSLLENEYGLGISKIVMVNAR